MFKIYFPEALVSFAHNNEQLKNLLSDTFDIYILDYEIEGSERPFEQELVLKTQKPVILTSSLPEPQDTLASKYENAIRSQKPFVIKNLKKLVARV
jgi:hypothetical protein